MSAEIMESLDKQQRICHEEMTKIITNFKKDSESRKTISYIKTKLLRLQNTYTEFVNRDNEILQIKAENSEHKYFTQNYCDQIEDLYDQIKDVLEKKLEKLVKLELEKQKEKEPLLTDQQKTTKTDENTTKVNHNLLEKSYNFEAEDKLLKKQRETMKLLDRIILGIENEEDQPHSDIYYQQKLKTIQNYWEKISILHIDIITADDNNYELYLKNEYYQEMEDRYQEINIYLQEKIANKDDKAHRKNVNLPNVQIPLFNGEFLEWKQFQNLFNELIINNKDIGNAQKLLYLKRSLTGEADKLVKNFKITTENFITVWEILCERYDNKRVLLQNQLNSFFFTT